MMFVINVLYSYYFYLLNYDGILVCFVLCFLIIVEIKFDIVLKIINFINIYIVLFNLI